MFHMYTYIKFSYIRTNNEFWETIGGKKYTLDFNCNDKEKFDE